MSVLKKLKELGKEAGLKFAGNANEKAMKSILEKGEVDFSHLYAEEKKELAPSKVKTDKDKYQEAKMESKAEGKFYLGDCVKTGKPLYKKLK